MDWNTVAALATAIGVSIAAWQIWEARRLAQTTFEDSMDQQYRELAKCIPVDALIGKPIPDQLRSETRELIYNYLDLSNEQVFLRYRRRIRRRTWDDWCAGMATHLSKDEFNRVWHEVKVSSPGTFSFLERLEAEEFSGDPARWD